MISHDEMKMIILSDTIQLIDVRSVEEFQEKHLKGAQNIVFDDDFEANVLQLDQSKPVAVYCRTGRRSKECAEILKENGFVKIYELEEGIAKWEFDDFMILGGKQEQQINN